MKIASYNILSGGFESYQSTQSIPRRLPLLKKALKKIEADFVSLIDTFRWKDIFSDQDLKKHFGYPYVYSIDMNDTRVDPRVGLTVLSRFPMKNKTIRLHNRDAIESRLKVDGADYNLFTLYLDDLNEDVRLKQVKVLEKKLKQEKVILMGDLNSFLRTDLPFLPGLLESARAALKMSTKQIYQFMTEILPAVRQMKRCEAVAYLSDELGLVNAIPDFEPTMPSKLFPGGMDRPFIRVDYFFHSPDVKPKKAQVVYGELFDQTSDHFPVVMEI